jgi:hypothetical protein
MGEKSVIGTKRGDVYDMCVNRYGGEDLDCSMLLLCR